MADSSSRKRFLVALVAGFVAIPALALATGFAWSDGESQEAPSASPESTTIVTRAEPTVAASVTDVTTGEQTEVDFETALVDACGPAGMELVDKETSGEISNLEQGVLDALREVCAENDMALPAKPAPEPTEQIVIVEEVTAPAGTVAGSPDDSYEEGDETGDDEYEEEEDEGAEEEDGEEEEEDD